MSEITELARDLVERTCAAQGIEVLVSDEVREVAANLLGAVDTRRGDADGIAS